VLTMPSPTLKVGAVLAGMMGPSLFYG